MARQFLVLIVGTLVLLPAANADEPEWRSDNRPEPNQVFVKIIMPSNSADRDEDGHVVESWIAARLGKPRGAKFTAVTGWVPLDRAPLEATDVWDGRLGKQYHCPVGADIPAQGDGCIKVHLGGWSPGGAFVTVSLTDEPGSRVVAGVEEYQTTRGMPYVAVLIGPPPAKPAAPINRRR